MISEGFIRVRAYLLSEVHIVWQVDLEFAFQHSFIFGPFVKLGHQVILIFYVLKIGQTFKFYILLMLLGSALVKWILMLLFYAELDAL